MKKISFAIIFMVILFFMPLFCSADVGLPFITPYEVRVNNVNGLAIYTINKESVTLPYDTILTINYEMRFYNDDKLYGSTSYNNEEYYVDLSQVSVVLNERDTSGLTPHEEQTMYVYEEGAYLYKGPSKLYDKIDGNIMIPAGTIISFEYADEMWAYVEYDGHKGWVYIYQMIDVSPYGEGSCLVEINQGTKYTLKELHLTENPDGDKENGVVVPAFTEVSYKYTYTPYAHKYAICIEYNGKEGWYIVEDFETADIYNYRDIELIAVKELPVYSEFRNENSEVLTTIPVNAECNILYYATDDYWTETWCYISYNGIEGWVKEDYENDNYSIEDYYFNSEYKTIVTYKLLVNKELYDTVDGNSAGTIIPSGTTLYRKYYYNTENSEWMYIYNDNYKGWIKYKYSDLEEIDRKENLENENITDIEEIKNEEVAVQSGNGDINIQFISLMNIIIICIVVALIISVLSIMILKVVNKKKEE